MHKFSSFFIFCCFFQSLNAQPAIISFSPISGPIGTTVTLAGNNFDPTPSNNIVYLGAVRAVVSAATSTSLTITVPIGTTYQPISVTTANLTGYSNYPFTVTFTGAGPGFVAGSFASGINIATGADPEGICSSDFDGDGKPDIAVANAVGNTISVHRNTGSSGNISLGPKLDLASGTFPICVNAGDIDGDGKPDILIANLNANTVSVFRNISTIGILSFAARLDLPVGVSPTFIAIGDLDLDGKPDLVVTNGGSNTVSFLKNTTSAGSISFAPKIDFATNTDPENVVLCDMDGDMIADMAVLNSVSKNVSVFRNTTVGNAISFAPKINFGTGNAPYGLAAADLDGDGKTDLVTANSSSASVSVLLNNGSLGTISFAPKIDYSVGNVPFFVNVSDLDGDGKPDLATVNHSSNTISVHKNMCTPGNISFANQVLYGTSTNPNNINLCDFDGDGMNDMAVANRDAGTISIFRSTVTAPFSPNIASFSPGSAGTGTEVTITGTNLSGTSSISFGGTPATSFTVVSATTVKAIVAGGTSGNITLTTSFGTATATGFTYLPAPVINSFSPVIGFTGATITISGSNFTGVTAVNFGGTAASSFKIVSASTITAVVAAGTSGNLIVSAAGGIGIAPGFIYEPPPVISSFNPSAAPVGTVITINGNNFIGTDSVYIGETAAASFKVVSPTVISATVAAISGGNVTVITPYGRIKKEGFYNGLRITEFTPLFGPVGTNVTISGLNFSSIADSNIVYFGAVRAVVTSATPTQLTVEVPAGGTYQPISVTSKGHVAFTEKQFCITTPNPGIIDTIAFTAAKALLTNSGPYEAAIGDLNGDGRADLATTGNNPASFSIFTNSGRIGEILFVPKVDYATPFSPPTKISLVDINGDGKPDLIADFNGGLLWIYKNTGTNGALTFAPKVIDTLAGNSYENMAVADFDGDGKPDFAIGNENSNAIAVARNTSNSNGISFATPLFFGVNNMQSVSVAVGDFDGDGKMDMAASSYNYNKLLIFKNISSPGNILFAAPVIITTDNGGGTTVAADFDNDGRTDIAVANHVYHKVTIFRNSGNIGTIQFAGGIDYATGTNAYNMVAGDINGDGKPDLAVANIISNSISLFQNNSTSGAILFSPKVDYFIGTYVDKVSLGDFDNDGKTDIAVTSIDSIVILRNQIGEPIKATLCPNGNVSVSSNIAGPNYQWQVNQGGGFQDIGNDANYSDVGSGTLKLSGIPSAWYGYEYRCLVNGSYSRVVKIRFVNNWTGAASSAWEDPGNWTCGAVPDANSDVVITSGTVVLNSNATCRTITVKPGATFTIGSGFTLTVTH
ncbi:MAG: FG-GAP-like repeat-containing protein [Chitinophagaceae bacterium]